ncbi:MAG: hypothetical protein ACE5K4_03860 [Candidatus Hydrothermarchaeota archaeon]
MNVLLMLGLGLIFLALTGFTLATTHVGKYFISLPLLFVTLIIGIALVITSQAS